MAESLEMLSDNNGKDYKLDIELLKKDVSTVSKLCDKIEISVDKMQTTASDISRGFFEQEQRLKLQDRINRDMEEALEKHIKKSEEHSREMNVKIENVDEKIDMINESLKDKIKESQNAIVAEMQGGREQLKQEIIKISENFNKKINDIDTWRYMIMGAIALFVFLVGNLTGITKLFR